mmetsp:Transcript_9907/g.12169  ORF Transcript_9907/g.12169 Transcript_9907/m.12169 type:complete len:554 (+) Transcript_9907:74-1735(+)
MRHKPQQQQIVALATILLLEKQCFSSNADAFSFSPVSLHDKIGIRNQRVSPTSFTNKLIIDDHLKKNFALQCPPGGENAALQATKSYGLNKEGDKKEASFFSSDNANLVAVTSTCAIIVLDVILRRIFQKLSIAFPSSLAGCGILFATLLASGDSLYNLFSPGAAVLAKWLPVFFVPSLVTLPLAEPLGSSMEVIKISSVILGGFLFTLLSTSWSVLGVRNLMKSGSSAASTSDANTGSADGYLQSLKSDSSTSAVSKPKPAFSASTLNALSFSAITCGALATLASRTSSLSCITAPAKSAFLLFTTLSTFVLGATRVPASITKIIHPLVTCTSLTWILAKVLGLLTNTGFRDMLLSYKVGSLLPLAGTGAGDVLLFMLGPAVVALACQMYNRKTLMKQNIAEVSTAVVGSSVGGLFGTAFMVRLVQILNPSIRLSLLSRNITSPLAMAIASMLGLSGADVSLAVSMVVVSGLIGANFGAAILDSVKIFDPVARGLGIGAASHGLGTAAFSKEQDAFPFAAIAMALTASFSTVMVSVPLVKNLLVKIALGGGV